MGLTAGDAGRGLGALLALLIEVQQLDGAVGVGVGAGLGRELLEQLLDAGGLGLTRGRGGRFLDANRSLADHSVASLLRMSGELHQHTGVCRLRLAPDELDAVVGRLDAAEALAALGRRAGLGGRGGENAEQKNQETVELDAHFRHLSSPVAATAASSLLICNDDTMPLPNQMIKTPMYNGSRQALCQNGLFHFNKLL